MRSEARPTEAVYMDRKVRGHASKHVVGAKLQGLESWPQEMRKIRDLLQLFCKVMQTAICITDTGSLHQTSIHKSDFLQAVTDRM